MATVKLYKTIFRFTLFNLNIDRLHELINLFGLFFQNNSIELKRMEMTLQYVCIMMYYDLHVDYCILKPMEQ